MHGTKCYYRQNCEVYIEKRYNLTSKSVNTQLQLHRNNEKICGLLYKYGKLQKFQVVMKNILSNSYSATPLTYRVISKLLLTKFSHHTFQVSDETFLDTFKSGYFQRTLNNGIKIQ